jgi:hypothetical protein
MERTLFRKKLAKLVSISEMCVFITAGPRQASSINSLRKCPPPPPRILNFGQGSVVDTQGVF